MSLNEEIRMYNMNVQQSNAPLQKRAVTQVITDYLLNHPLPEQYRKQHHIQTAETAIHVVIEELERLIPAYQKNEPSTPSLLSLNYQWQPPMNLFEKQTSITSTGKSIIDKYIEAKAIKERKAPFGRK